jgi:hypothetical protein
MLFFIRKYSLFFIFLLLSGCAAVNPNPNVGMRTVDRLLQGGDCAGARNAAEPAAMRGEPWAQFRMGAILIDEKCPRPSKEEAKIVVEWLQKAAAYESKNAWERGNELAVGPNGFFNARASSTNAAIMLANISVRSGHPDEAWSYIDRAISQYDFSESERKNLERTRKDIEARMSADMLAKLQSRKDADFSKKQ